MQTVVLSSCVLLGAVLLVSFVNKAESNPLPNRDDLLNGIDDGEDVRIRNPYFYDLLANIEQVLQARRELLENQKRGLDLGLSRGFSGSQAAKHLMGLAAANFAGGPGRRRRSLEQSL